LCWVALDLYGIDAYVQLIFRPYNPVEVEQGENALIYITYQKITDKKILILILLSQIISGSDFWGIHMEFMSFVA
jgi:hypothetical protein